MEDPMNSKFLVLAAIVTMLITFTKNHAYAEDAILAGYTPGAEVMDPAITRPQIDAIDGVVYSQIFRTTGVRQLEMSLLIPRTSELKPAIIFFPGGGFKAADNGKYCELRMDLAEAGYVVASAEYRVVPDKFPALVEDGKSAVRYLREHAQELNIDPSRIGVLGNSAGGYLAQMVGLTNGEKDFDKGRFLDKSSDVQAAATIFGISNLMTIGEGFPDKIKKVHESPAVTEALLVHGPAFASFTGASIMSDPAKAMYASPMGHIEGKKPPFLIMHGSGDTLVSPMQSEKLYLALKKEKNKADYILLKGAQHGTQVWFQKPVIDKVVDWFKENLGLPVKGKVGTVDENADL